MRSYEMTPVKSRDTLCDAVEPLIVSKLNFAARTQSSPPLSLRWQLSTLPFVPRCKVMANKGTRPSNFH